MSSVSACICKNDYVRLTWDYGFVGLRRMELSPIGIPRADRLRSMTTTTGNVHYWDYYHKPRAAFPQRPAPLWAGRLGHAGAHPISVIPDEPPRPRRGSRQLALHHQTVGLHGRSGCEVGLGVHSSQTERARCRCLSHSLLPARLREVTRKTADTGRVRDLGTGPYRGASAPFGFYPNSGGRHVGLIF